MSTVVLPGQGNARFVICMALLTTLTVGVIASTSSADGTGAPRVMSMSSTCGEKTWMLSSTGCARGGSAMSSKGVRLKW